VDPAIFCLNSLREITERSTIQYVRLIRKSFDIPYVQTQNKRHDCDLYCAIFEIHLDSFFHVPNSTY